jgi:SAM-dependent methyltransferase
MTSWDELYQNEQYRDRVPYPLVIELEKILRPHKPLQILDLGCGAGRHLVFLTKSGHKVIGMDRSPIGLFHAQQKAEMEGFFATLSRADMTRIPFANESFDAILSINVIFHNPLHLMRKTINEIFRLLRPGGIAVITFQSTRSHRWGNGEMIEPNTYIPNIGLDKGVIHHFSTFQELGVELEQFVIRRIQLNESVEEGQVRSSHWEVLIEKPFSGRNVSRFLNDL